MPARLPTDVHLTGVTPARSESLLDAIEYRFRLCGEGPQPLSVDGRQLGHGLPRRLIPLTELSAILMHPRAARPRRTRPGCTVTNARTDPDRWVVEAVGVGFRGRSCLDEAGERCGPGIVRAVWDKGLGVGESLPRFREMASRSRRGHQLSPYLRLGELIRQCTGEWYAAGGDGRHQSGRRLPSPLSSAEGSDECRCPIEESHPLPRRAPP